MGVRNASMGVHLLSCGNSEQRDVPVNAVHDALVIAALAGDAEAVEGLMNQYKPLVRARAHAFYLAGADREDLVQEGMIGLFKAIRDFVPEVGASFPAFATLCVNRQMMTAVKTAARKKHQPLNTSLSLSTSVVDKRTGRSIGLLRQLDVDPEQHFIQQEENREMNRVIENHLSMFEKQVMCYYLEGLSYGDIGNKLKKPTKSVDNALQRIRKKMGMHLKRPDCGETTGF